jgi:hypothetical protein
MRRNSPLTPIHSGSQSTKLYAKILEGLKD